MQNYNIKSMLKEIAKEKRHLKVLKTGFLLGAVIFSLYGIDFYFSLNNEIKKIEENTSNLSRTIEQQLNSSFMIIEIVLSHLQEKITENYNLKNKFLVEEVRNDFKKKLSSTRDTIAIRLFDEKGNFVVDSSGLISKVNVSDRKYFINSKNKSPSEFVISEPIFSRITSSWVTVFSKKLEDKNKKFIGVVIATIQLSDLEKKFDQIELGENKLISLYGLDRTNYFRIPRIESLIGNVASHLDFEYFKKNNNKFQLTELYNSKQDSIYRIITRTKFNNYPFVVTVGISVKDGLSAFFKRTLTNFLILVFTFGIFIVFLIRYLYSEIELIEQRKQSLQSSKLSSLGEMASGIAHEINNPLTIIQTSVNSIKRTLIENKITEDDKAFVNLDRVNRNATRIAKIVRGLRNFSRDSYNDPYENVTTQRIISEVLDISFERFRHQGIELKIENLIPELLVECRVIQIGQVLMNLLNNSFDAIQDSTEEKWVKIKVIKAEGVVRFLVSDSGKGIPGKIIDKMMEPFFTTKEIGKGTGLGLSISKGIIDNHNGKLEYLENESNTTFMIELPLKHV